MKYQCNSCGVVYENRSSAVNCHPDINEIPDEELESRLAAQQCVQADECQHLWKNDISATREICEYCGTRR